MQRISDLRKKIDTIDEQILLLLKERLEVSKRIGRMKKDHGLPLRDPRREEEVYAKVMKEASQRELDPSEIEALYQKIIAMCLHVQE